MRIPLLALAALAAAPAPQQSGAAGAAPSITFFVGSDSHFGYVGMEDANRAMVEQMNALPGTPYPESIGGRVETPRGVLMTGDLTDNGTLEEFAEFEKLYGLTGKDALLRYPVYESVGNHDVNSESPIKERQKARHGGINFAWDWEDLRLLCLDMYTDAKKREWRGAEVKRR